jgi:putative flippase GtrA
MWCLKRDILFNVEFFRFVLVGILNTFIGLSVIFILIYFSMNNYLANLVGYLIGLIFSFLLHKNYTFKNKANTINRQMLFFLLVFLISFSINIFILYISLEYYTKYISQLLAIIAYTTISYLLNKFITFKE